MKSLILLIAASGWLLSGCSHNDTYTGPSDIYAPAAPQSVVSTTGDRTVWLNWLPNTEEDVAGYRIYEGPCASGPECPYTFIGMTTGTSYSINGLANGVTRFFAVAAVDYAGNESELSYEDVFDTPRPEGFGLRLMNADDDPDLSGYDFSRYSVVPFDDEETDIFFAFDGSIHLMFAAYEDTDIQGAGWVETLDEIDWAPENGWSPTGTTELIPGHAYVVWTYDNHFAKFRVVSLSPERVVLDWAYQVATGNPELRARPVREEGQPRVPRNHPWPTR
jgi:hypothetical protein